MIRDIVRAVLVLVVLAVGCEILAVHGRREAATPAWQPHQAAYPPAWQPVPQPPAWQPMQAPQPGPLRRVAREVVDLSEAFIGVIR
jgi:hypothetical protein